MSLWIVPTEPAQRAAVKGRWIPFAFDRIDLIATMNDDEVDLISRAVTPVPDRVVWIMRLQMFKDQVLPEAPIILWSEWIPAAGKADKPRIESIDPGLLDDLVLPSSVKWSNHGDCVADLHRLEVALHCRT